MALSSYMLDTHHKFQIIRHDYLLLRHK